MSYDNIFIIRIEYKVALKCGALEPFFPVKVDSLRDSASAPGNGLRTFSGQITRIGSVVEGETRIIPVQAQLDNSFRQLKPGMFAQLEVLTNQTPTARLAISHNTVVKAKGKQLVYIQNGDAYQSTEVKLGQTSGNMVEVKSGLFEGDRIVTQVRLCVRFYYLLVAFWKENLLSPGFLKVFIVRF